MLHLVIVLFFIFLIVYQLCVYYLALNASYGMYEGFDSKYEEYNFAQMPTDSMQLAEQNAKNISYLKEQIENESSTEMLAQKIQDLSGNIATLTQQMQDLINAQQSYAENNLPQDPPDISGL